MFSNFWKRSSLHPYLAVVFVVLQTFRLYGEPLSTSLLIEQIVILLIAFAVIWLFLKVVWSRYLHSSSSLAIVFTFCLLACLLYEPAMNTLRILFGFFRDRYLILLLGVVLVAVTYIATKIRYRKLVTATSYINLLLLILSLLEVYYFIERNPKSALVSMASVDTNERLSPKPNIYFILLDGYTNPETTPHYFGFENRGLVDSLAKMGFYIAKNSKSNYRFTYQSIGSALNMEYLGKPYPEKFITFKSIQNNIFTHAAKRLGYQFHNLSIFSMANQISPFLLEGYAQESFGYTNFLFSRTIAGPFVKKAKNFLMNDRRIHENSMNGFKALDNLTSDTTSHPQFAYLHSLVSHGPFWMDSSGAYSDNVVQRNMTFAKMDMTGWYNGTFENRDLGDVQIENAIVRDYQTHLRIANKLTLKSVKKILTNKPNSVIIVMSDHGFRYLMRHSVEDTRAEQYANLCAVYFPDQMYGELNSGITPINVFRAVSNKVFGTSLQSLPDVSGL